MVEKARFCVDCACVPEGVVAEVRSLVYQSDIRMKSMGYSSLNRQSRGALEEAAQTVAIHTVVVEASSSSGVEIGDPGILRVKSGGRDEGELIDDIMKCPGPKRSLVARVFGRKFAKFMGVKDTCQAVEPI